MAQNRHSTKAALFINMKSIFFNESLKVKHRNDPGFIIKPSKNMKKEKCSTQWSYRTLGKVTDVPKISDLLNQTAGLQVKRVQNEKTRGGG